MLSRARKFLTPENVGQELSIMAGGASMLSMAVATTIQPDAALVGGGIGLGMWIASCWYWLRWL